jgi:uncharacterized protein (DUF302 family)
MHNRDRTNVNGPLGVLGTCNPALAYEALQLEDKVLTMLPCNVVVQEVAEKTEVAAIDSAASMQAHSHLLEAAACVQAMLRKVVENLSTGPSLTHW